MNATVCRADLNVADMDRHYYADHALTIARHASETDERMMVRTLAFALHSHERLAFGRGIGTADEPDVWLHDLTGRIELWIDVGQPDDKRVRKACSVSERVVVYTYGGRTSEVWWAKTGPELKRFDNLEVIALSVATSDALTEMAERSMSLQLTVQDGEAWFACGDARIVVERTWLKGGPQA